jgi:hypothetical protein
MIKKIYSKNNPNILLNIIYFGEPYAEISEKKCHEITEAEHFLQAICFDLPSGKIINPHKHNLQERKTDNTHEAFVVFKGCVELSIYDIDNRLLEKFILNDGDCSTIINGGHSIKVIKPTRLFEFKNGPFFGPEKDKMYFN